ncbi:hypothetical protein L5515_015958 [Caenorhabditis briggsae]|uniref:Uncharacterized protein n=1 Tax=Caenorhabditis briggsae TaxID=6238 RepID=A0AAE9ED15_CAEBR|nr:hypothetical protein L5515_015958 [Caenorhabditis briggsae]
MENGNDKMGMTIVVRVEKQRDGKVEYCAICAFTEREGVRVSARPLRHHEGDTVGFEEGFECGEKWMDERGWEGKTDIQRKDGETHTSKKRVRRTPGT